MWGGVCCVSDNAGLLQGGTRRGEPRVRPCHHTGSALCPDGSPTHPYLYHYTKVPDLILPSPKSANCTCGFADEHIGSQAYEQAMIEDARESKQGTV